MHELMERAVLLEREEQFAEAAEVWGQLAAAGEQPLAAAGCPSLSEIRKRQAGAHFHAGQFQAAIDVLNALRREEANAEILGLLTRVYLDAKHFEDAVKAGRQTLEIEPDDVQAKRALGRAYMELGKQAGPTGGALHWQDAIDQFTDILVLFNPRDELAKELKLYCVLQRDDAFGATMQSQFRQFIQLVDRDDRPQAFEVLSELVRIVIEHAVDIQQQRPQGPAQTVRIANNFIAMIEDYSRKSSMDLTSRMGSVFAQLHSLAMWAHLVNGDPGNAELALDRAVRAAPQDTLPWVSKADLMFALQRSDEVQPALERAKTYVRSEHDRFLMGATDHMLGEYDRALAWIEQIDIAKFKTESYRPDRAERILLRLKTEIEDEKTMGVPRTPEELESGELTDAIKRLLTGGVTSAEKPGATKANTEE